MNISHGMTEQNVVVGNVYDKYNATNPIARWLMRGFETALNGLIDTVQPATMHEVGCGEGYWVLRWVEQGRVARGSDFSTKMVALAEETAQKRALPAGLFQAKSIYELTPECDSAELVICCEVLEHVDDPHAALRILQSLAQPYLIVSVPREPLWRVLNMLRGAYLGAWGNTPGHIQHWSKAGFIQLIAQYFDILAVRSPLPWTMLLCKVINND